MQLAIRQDHLTETASRELVARHLRGMHENSPMDSCFALDIDGLLQPGVTFWTGWDGPEIAVMGALKRLDETNGEIKSMRVADAYLGRGAGRVMLYHVLAQARAWGLSKLWLETGSTPAFVPALKLYESEGFAFCGPFGSYVENPFSRFMSRAV